MTAAPRVLVTGSRSWRWYDIVHAALACARHEAGPLTVVHGACPAGADAMAARWVRQHGTALDVAEERWPADWRRLGRRAGFARNAAMVATEPALVLAFVWQDSPGASHTVRLAHSAGIPVRLWTSNAPMVSGPPPRTDYR